ncbi:MAG: HAD family hydrolase [Muribaculaceae bacterium]|nr:HAD family hydrolase [Muribaculaceae bacterium]
MTTELVIFDLDGTLVNTIADLASATNYALAAGGYPTHHMSAYPFYVGNGVTKLIERALPSEARNESEIERVRAFFKDYYDDHLTDSSAPYAGIPELLSELQSRGIRLAVASNKYQSAVERIVAHFFPTVAWVAVEGQKPGVPVKPDPSIVFQVLLNSPAPKDSVLYAGDSGVDMETAWRAGVESVGVTWGFRPESELAEYNACNIIGSPAQLLDIIDSKN